MNKENVETTGNSESSSSVLLACHCGSMPEYVETGNGLYKYRLQCPQCGKRPRWMSVKKVDAISNWNKRVG